MSVATGQQLAVGNPGSDHYGESNSYTTCRDDDIDGSWMMKKKKIFVCKESSRSTYTARIHEPMMINVQSMEALFMCTSNELVNAATPQRQPLAPGKKCKMLGSK